MALITCLPSLCTTSLLTVQTTSENEQQFFISNVQTLPLTSCIQQGEHFQNVRSSHSRVQNQHFNSNNHRSFSRACSSIASDILTPVASTSPGHYHVNFRLSNFATHHNQTRGWVQLSVFRWIAILLFSMTTLELTCILILRALR